MKYKKKTITGNVRKNRRETPIGENKKKTTFYKTATPIGFLCPTISRPEYRRARIPFHNIPQIRESRKQC